MKEEDDGENTRKVTALEKFLKKQKEQAENNQILLAVDVESLTKASPINSENPWGLILVKKGDEKQLIFDELKARYGEIVSGLDTING